MPPVAPHTIGKYQIIDADPIGKGGMGTVYLARDPDSGRRVAIKTVNVGAPEEFVARFNKEGKLARLQHENIVTIYETGRSADGRPYIVMEYIEGQSLDKLSSPTSLPLVEKLKCIQQLCEGLYYAHSNDVIHRDIKPANAIRAKRDGKVKILDFGIARDESRTDDTINTVLIGSPNYMSPERLNGARGDARVDIFAAGVTLYFLLSGKLPFEGDYEEVRAKILHDPFPPLSEHLSQYPAKLDEIINIALAKNRLDRYSSAQEFADELSLVIDELNSESVVSLLDDAERLIAEGKHRLAEEKANEAVKIDRQNRRAKDLRSRAIRLYEHEKDEQKLREVLRQIDAATFAQRFDDAVRLIEEALQLKAGDQVLEQRLVDAKQLRRKQREIEEYVANATAAENSGDVTAALMLYLKAIDIDPSNDALRVKATQLKEERQRLDRRLKIQLQIDAAKQKLASNEFAEAIGILEAIKGESGSHPELDSLYHDAVEGLEREKSAKLSQQFVAEAQKHFANGDYEKASEVVDQAILALPGDTSLRSLKKKIAVEQRDTKTREQIAAVVSEVQRRLVVSLPDALKFLREEMLRFPRAERLESLERDLIDRQKRLVKEERRKRCVLDASGATASGEFSAAVEVIEAYFLEYASDWEIDELLRQARSGQEEQNTLRRISECASRARSFIAQGRFEDALSFLVTLEAETHDLGLIALIEEAKAGKADVDRKLKVLSQRISQLRKEGKLGEAIALIEGQTTALVNSSVLQELLVGLRNELKKLTALTEAISRSRHKVENWELASAREPLEDVRRVYGDFEALTQATAELDRYRARAADGRVAKSIEEAKAAILAGDKSAARKALETSAAPISFATATVVQDWERLAKEIKVPPPSQGPTPKPPKFPIWTIPAGIVLVAAIIVAVLHFGRTAPTTPTPPPAPAEAFIRITKAPPGAIITIDGKASEPPDANGERKIEVKPGVKHHVEVSKDGFDSFQDDPTVGAGETLSEVPTLPAKGTSGTLSFQGFPKEFTLFVDGARRTVRDGKAMTLPEGSPRIGYSVLGYQESPATRIPIKRNQDQLLVFNKQLDKLVPSPVTTTAPINQTQSNQPQTQVENKQQPANVSGTTATGLAATQQTQAGTQQSGQALPSNALPNPPKEEPKAMAPVTPPVPEAGGGNTPAKSTAPDRAALEAALKSMQGIFSQASVKKGSDCKAALSKLPASKIVLGGLQQWCGGATFAGHSACKGSPAGNDQEATWSCTETVDIGGQKPTDYKDSIFTFARSAEGTWRVVKWDWHE